MSVRTRAIALFLLVTAIVGFGLFVAEADTGPEAAPTARLQFVSSTQCASCHKDVFDEWHGSHHQIAYLNEEVRALSDDFRNKECQLQ